MDRVAYPDCSIYVGIYGWDGLPRLFHFYGDTWMGWPTQTVPFCGDTWMGWPTQTVPFLWGYMDVMACPDCSIFVRIHGYDGLPRLFHFGGVYRWDDIPRPFHCCGKHRLDGILRLFHLCGGIGVA